MTSFPTSVCLFSFDFDTFHTLNFIDYTTTKIKGVLAFEVRLKIPGARFEKDEIDRKQYLEGLSSIVANKQ
jgi:hypothetical protein